MSAGPWRRKVPAKPTRKAVHAAFEAQRPLDQAAKPLERKKPVRRDWDERPDLEQVED